MARSIFTDGENSFSHFFLGALGRGGFALPFAFYQFGIQGGKPNDWIDMAEYIAGWFVGSMFGETTPCGMGDFQWWNPGTWIQPTYGTGQPAVQSGDTSGDTYGPPLSQTPGGINIIPGTCFGNCYIQKGDEGACLNQCTTVTGTDTSSGHFNFSGGSLNPLNPAALATLPSWWPIAALVAAFFLLRK